MYSSLANLLLLASLEERSTYRELACFLGVKDNGLDRDNLIDKTIRDKFVLFWKTIEFLVVEALSCFQK